MVVDRLESRPDDNYLIPEVSRIASLRFALSSYLSISLSKLDSISPQLMRGLSFKHHDNQILQDRSDEFSADIPEGLGHDEFMTSLSQSDPSEFCELLAWIHALGSFAISSRGLSEDSRRVLGAYYTPRVVADYIVENTIGPKIDEMIQRVSLIGSDALSKIAALSVLDPACGPGAFLISSLRILMTRARALMDAAERQGFKQQDLESVGLSSKHVLTLDSFYGVDLDAAALEIAKVSMLLMNQGRSVDALKLDVGPKLRKGDSLVSMNGMSGDSDYRSFFSNLARKYPLEWRTEFPEVFRRGGFSFVVMNPPYDRLKPNFAEFLRERLIAGDRAIHENQYDEHRLEMKEDVAYFRKSGEYTLGNRHTIDLYRLFIERALQLTQKDSRIGCVVPTTLLGDVSAERLRYSLVDSNRVCMIEEFTESARLFEGVTQSVCIMVVERGGSTAKIDARFALEKIESESIPVTIPVDELRPAMGRYLNIPRVDRTGLSILMKVHSYPSLGSLSWIQNRRGELDLTIDKSFITNERTDNRLIRGANIARYDTVESKRPPEYVHLELFVKSKRTTERLKHTSRWRIACQQVSNRFQLWRLKFTLVQPGTILANSCNYILLDGDADKSLLYYILGLMNSNLLNWRFNVSSANNHVSNRELSALPIADPELVEESYLVDEIVSLVKNIDSSNPRDLLAIEAKVMKLYKLNKREVSHVLKSRGVTTSDISFVITEMKS